MSRLDDRLTRELERAARPADPAGAFEQVGHRYRRRRRLRKIQSGALMVVVLTGTVAGFMLLSKTFRERGPGIGDTPVVGNGAIVYSEIRNAGEHLWLVQPDGTGAEQITTDEGVSDASPAVSPDGRTIAFMRTGGSGSSIYTIRTDGTRPTRLTKAPALDPAWSPDGSQIAFAGGAFGPYGIWIMNADGTNPTLIPGTDELDVAHPTWSPDGTMIAFAGNSTGGRAATDWDIWTTDIKGFTQTNITAGSGGLWPSWSPDGSLILFARTAKEGASLMTIVPDPDASPTPLTDGTTLDQNPSWSPDGSSVLFDRTWAGGTDVYTMLLDGSDLTLVARNATTPAWQPEPTVPSESPIPTPAQIGPVDLGLGFPVCDPRTMFADMDGNGTLDTVTVATKMSDTAACPARGTTTEIVAVDLNGDGSTDGVGGPLFCPSGCLPFAAPDLDADGHPDLVLSVERTAVGTQQIEPLRVSVNSSSEVTIVPFTDGSGDSLNFEWGTENDRGSDGPMIFGVSCNARTTPPLVISWRAVQAPAPNSSYRIDEHGYHVEGTTLRSAFQDHYDVPGEETVFPDGGGAAMCGAPVVAPTSP